MLNSRKVRLMTKLAVFEEQQGKEDVKLSNYYRGDYVRLNVMKTIISTTVGFLILLALFAAYKMEYIVNEAINLNYGTILRLILAVYFAVLIVYIFATTIYYFLKYSKSRNRLTRYYRMLRRLKKIYIAERKEKEENEERKEEQS
ncbi:MAG: hypothetical protein MJ113_07490 [Lachnospiraceae bacterium]|nr:hypothetical protein [Lachnospiraceae bacterium]